ncbi:MAG: pyrroloquinoline quinone biosynthesis peptide chaperone PqqD [Candidatus Acidiferrales bacterium]
MTVELDSRPCLAVGCRLSENSGQARMLLMPERALRLNGPSLEIVERCDGRRTVRQIITELQGIYSKAEPEKVEQDILGYLAALRDKRALDFASGAAAIDDEGEG